MMKLKDSLFYAKILLFGEYSIIEDSMGLTMPYNFYQGRLKNDGMDSEENVKSNAALIKYFHYLNELAENGTLLCNLDLTTFKSDLDKGLIFDSNIPQGFGVGSSGALCAAIYSKYSVDSISAGKDLRKKQITDLKLIFSQLESYYHGQSSGIDPLICYLNIPLLIKSKSDIGMVGIPEVSEGKGAIFLLDSGSPGETQPLVNLYMEKMKNQGFRNLVKDEFVKYNDACIKSFLKSDSKSLFKNLKQLSHFLFENLNPMIPSVFHKLWKEGYKDSII